jgi:hypothetical protein
MRAFARGCRGREAQDTRGTCAEGSEEAKEAMMDEKQLAERIQGLIDTYDPADKDLIDDLRQLRDELELKTGIFVYWRFLGESIWNRGFSIEDGGETVIIIKDGTTVYPSQVEWKPVRAEAARMEASDD